MPATRLEMQQEVLYIIGNRTDISTSTIDNWVRRAYQHVTQAVEFPEALAEVSQTLTIGTSSYSLPADYFSIYAVRNSTAGHKCVQVSTTEYNDLPNNVTGPVELYAVFGNTIRVYPEPDTAEVLNIDYRKIFPDLTADGSTHELPDTWDQPIVMLASAYGFNHLNEIERARHYRGEARAFIREQTNRLAAELIDRNEAMGVIGGEIN